MKSKLGKYIRVLSVNVIVKSLAETWRVRCGIPGALLRYFEVLGHQGFGTALKPYLHGCLQVKEIKNGRLAMFANLGFFIQAIVTGKVWCWAFLDNRAS